MTKERAVGLTDAQVVRLACNFEGYISVDGAIMRIRSFLNRPDEQPLFKTTEKVVGLTDDQKGEIVNLFAYNEDESLEYAKILREYLDTQSFTGITEKVVGLTTKQIQKIAEQIASMKCDLTEDIVVNVITNYLSTQPVKQDTSPNWDTAPKWANYFAISLNGTHRFFEKKPTINRTGWFDNGGECADTNLCDNWQNSLQSRPVNTHNISTGGYIHTKTGNHYYVDGFSKTLVNGDWLDYVNYHKEEALYSRPIEDFANKFDRIG